MALDIRKIRSDFPVLSQDVVYFDNACMTLKPRQVLEAMRGYYEDYTACSGRSVHRFADRTNLECAKARESVAKLMGGRADETVFTRNTTEGINLVANSLGLGQGDIVLTTDVEHNSNLLPWQSAARRNGIIHKVIPTDRDFQPDLGFLEQELKTGRVRLLSAVLVSNISGTRMPVERMAKLARSNGALVMLDGAQSVPGCRTDVGNLGCDFLAFSGHKMCGPTGTGVLWGRKGLLEKMEPFIVGGETVTDTTYTTANMEKPPAKFEAGLQDYAGIIGLGAAAGYLQKIGMGAIEERKAGLVGPLVEGLADMAKVDLISPREPEKYATALANFTVRGLGHHQVAITLDEIGKILLRSGRHCVHSWYNSRGIEGSVRPSLYFYNTVEEVDFFLKTLKRVINDLT